MNASANYISDIQGLLSHILHWESTSSRIYFTPIGGDVHSPDKKIKFYL